MSKFVGIFRKQRGKVGDFVFRKQGNEYIVSERPPKKGTSMGTRNQSLYRAQWGNLVRFWQAFSDRDKPSFEAATINVSHFNLFMRANINGTRVYLTKEDVRLGGCVVAPYRVSEGSLPNVPLTYESGGYYASTIQLGELQIGANTTLSDFSHAVVQNNNDFEMGDQIAVFIATQIVESVGGLPRVRIQGYKVELTTEDDLPSEEDATLLSVLMGTGNVSAVDGHLCVARGDGAVIVHSRKASTGETLVSTQSFVVNNGILAQYTSADARLKAAESYGIIDRGDWLTPNGENEIAAN